MQENSRFLTHLPRARRHRPNNFHILTGWQTRESAATFEVPRNSTIPGDFRPGSRFPQRVPRAGPTIADCVGQERLANQAVISDRLGRRPGSPTSHPAPR